MSVNLFIERNDVDDMVIVVGANELARLWMPIISFKKLLYLEQAVSTGLSIDSENYADVVSETSQLLESIESQVEFEDDFVNPVYRCRRLLRLLKENGPETGAELYVG